MSVSETMGMCESVCVCEGPMMTSLLNRLYRDQLSAHQSKKTGVLV